MCVIGLATAALDFEELVELGLEACETACEVVFLAVEIGECLGLAEAFEGDGFEGDGVEPFEKFGEELVGFGFEAHAFDLEGDEAGFVDRDAVESPGEVAIFVDGSVLFRGFGGVAGEDVGSEVGEFLGIL